MTILSAVQDACPDLGLAKPASIVDATDDNAVRLLAFAHEAGDDIAQRGDWRRMLVYTSIPAGTLTYTAPDDFSRLVPGGAIYTATRVLRGPLSGDQYNQISAGLLGPTSVAYYGMFGGGFNFVGVPPADAIFMAWVRKQWIIDPDGTMKVRATADADMCLFPERLLTRAIVWRFRRETGLQYQDQMAEWEADLAMHLRQDRGVTV